jgi:molecular chaperone DnaK (HSP70)
MSKYSIGIDLGTTNSVVAYCALDAEHPTLELLPIPQLTAPSTIEARSQLPSYLYLATDAERAAGQFDLPDAAQREFAVGEAARRRGAEAPERTVTSAKSWLGHTRVDRHAAILPWNAPSDVPKLSPVTAAQRYLEQIVAAWNAAHPDAPLAEQSVTLTVPASFDASARELTREAALAAGLPPEFTLLEEPQAAVYAWLASQGDAWRKQLKVGDTLLVCDIGGGTTDLTLVGVVDEGGELNLRRLAVGPHLLVGGDNMDLALAFAVAEKFTGIGVNLDPWQSISLWHSCRAAKEQLLAHEGPAEQTITVLTRGTRLVGGSKSVPLARDEAANLLLDGFFPRCALGDKPAKRRGSGFQDLGLAYEQDTGITRHVAAFLSSQGTDAARPTRVLFNGGVFKSPLLRDRMLTTLGQWFGDASAVKPLAANDDATLDHAVALGAAHYGWSKQRGGLRIRGGTARSYYVGIETAGLAIPGAPRPLRALCVVPFGMEEGTQTDVPSNEIGLVVGEPVQFRFFGSLTRKTDKPGETLARWTEEELTETAPLEATLNAAADAEQDYYPVTFQSRITELGMFELWCRHTRGPEQWKLEFSVREE